MLSIRFKCDNFSINSVLVSAGGVITSSGAIGNLSTGFVRVFCTAEVCATGCVGGCTTGCVGGCATGCAGVCATGSCIGGRFTNLSKNSISISFGVLFISCVVGRDDRSIPKTLFIALKAVFIKLGDAGGIFNFSLKSSAAKFGELSEPIILFVIKNSSYSTSIYL